MAFGSGKKARHVKDSRPYYPADSAGIKGKRRRACGRFLPPRFKITFNDLISALFGSLRFVVVWWLVGKFRGRKKTK